jgi:hypothetical protein
MEMHPSLAKQNPILNNFLVTEYISHSLHRALNPLKTKCLLNNYKNSVHTSQGTHYFSATKPNQLRLFGETVTVYCENHMRDTNTLWYIWYI